MEKKFRFLRFFSVIMKVLAWIVLIGCVITAFILVIAGGFMPTQMSQYGPLAGMMGGAALGFFVVVLGLVYFLFLYAGSEIIMVFLAIEQNTRKPAKASVPKPVREGKTV